MNRNYKKTAAAFWSNIIVIMVTVCSSFFLPQVLNVTEYGYFQLFLFYIGISEILHLGWPDGMLLELGGAYYEKLDKDSLKTQLFYFLIFQAAACMALLLVALLIPMQSARKAVFVWLAPVAFSVNVKLFFKRLFQATERIREYAVISALEKLVYLLLICVLMLGGEKRFVYYIQAFALGNVFCVFYGISSCSDILKARLGGFGSIRVQTAKNIQAGSRLLCAALTQILLTGIVKQAVEIKWGVETFGRFSMALSISNMLLMLFSFLAVILFPRLCRMEEGGHKKYYLNVRTVCDICIYASLLLFFPGKKLFSMWLPQYVESIRYLTVFLPGCIFSINMTVLAAAYLKACRREKEFMQINVGSLLLSLLLSILYIALIPNIWFAVGSILFLYIFRYIWAERIIEKQLKARLGVFWLEEIIIAALFIIITNCLPEFLQMPAYFLVLLGVLFIKRNILKKIIREGTESEN